MTRKNKKREYDNNPLNSFPPYARKMILDAFNRQEQMKEQIRGQLDSVNHLTSVQAQIVSSLPKVSPSEMLAQKLGLDYLNYRNHAMKNLMESLNIHNTQVSAIQTSGSFLLAQETLKISRTINSLNPGGINSFGIPRSLMETISSINTVSPTLSYLYDSIQVKINKDKTNVDTYLKENYWVLPKNASEEFIVELLENINNDDFDIDALFVDYFSANDYEKIIELKNKWDEKNKIPPNPHKIINGNINTILSQGLDSGCSTVIPLMREIDGLIKEIISPYGFKNNPGENRYWNIYDRSLPRCSFTDAFDNHVVNKIVVGWEFSPMKKLLINILFASSHDYRAGLVPIKFNRHMLAHPEIYGFDTFENVIRCLLIIDFLHDLIF